MTRIVTLTMNPAVDVSTSVERVLPTAKLRCGPGRRDPGGGGVNVARVARELGAEALAIYPAGGLVGDALQQLVRAEGVMSRVVPIAGETREDFNVVETASGAQFRFILPGPRLHGREWLACLQALADAAADGDLICASGSLPPGAPDDFYARVAQLAAGRRIRLALDTSGAALKAALRERVFLLKPNLAELEALTGSPLPDEPAQLAACRDLIRRGSAEYVALTLGAQGAMLVSSHEAWRADAVHVRTATSVGAGDAFLAGLIWALAGGKPPEEALRWAVAAGSAALAAPGTELCRADDVRRLHADATARAIALDTAAG
jgi:6-phosphofructokinase 2